MASAAINFYRGSKDTAFCFGAISPEEWRAICGSNPFFAYGLDPEEMVRNKKKKIIIKVPKECP